MGNLKKLYSEGRLDDNQEQRGMAKEDRGEENAEVRLEDEVTPEADDGKIHPDSHFPIIEIVSIDKWGRVVEVQSLIFLSFIGVLLYSSITSLFFMMALLPGAFVVKLLQLGPPFFSWLFCKFVDWCNSFFPKSLESAERD